MVQIITTFFFTAAHNQILMLASSQKPLHSSFYFQLYFLDWALENSQLANFSSLASSYLPSLHPLTHSVHSNTEAFKIFSKNSFTILRLQLLSPA